MIRSRLSLGMSALVVGALAAGCGPAGVPSTKGDRGAPPASSGSIRLLIIASSDIRDIPLGLAVEDLEARGYAVQVTPVLSGTLMTEALARGDAELGSFNNETMWTAIAKGVRARTLLQRLSFPNLLMAKREVTDCRALDGRPVALGAATGLNPRLVTMHLDRRCPGTRPRILVIPDSTARASALVTGAVDAALVPFEEVLKLEHSAPGRYAPLADLNREFPLLQVTGVHARGAWLDEHPRAARDFIRALLVAHRKIRTDPEVLYSKVVEQLRLDPGMARTLVDASLAANAWDPNGALTRENVEYTLDFLKAAKAVPETLRFEDVADLSYLDAVLAELGRQ